MVFMWCWSITIVLAILFGAVHEAHPVWRTDGDGQGGRMGFMGAFMQVFVLGTIISIIVWFATL